VSPRKLVVVCVALAALPGPVRAARPSSGAVGPGPSTLRYRGARIGVGAPASAGGPATCVEGRTCDTFELTVRVPENLYKRERRELTVTITWADKEQDLDLYVCRGTAQEDPGCLRGEVGSSAQSGSTSETVTLENPEAGVYRLIAKAFAGASSYEGTVTFAPPVERALATVRSASGAFGWAARPMADDASFGEPSIDVDHSNAIYITAPGDGGVQMWRSFDLGQSFRHIEIPSDGGGGDSEIEFLSNDVGLTADLRVSDSAISRSKDRFETWTQQGAGIEQDRQWLAHRCARLVLLAYHDFVLEAEMVTRSTDGGLTWEQVPVFVSPAGTLPGRGDEADVYENQGVNTFSGPVVVDQRTGDAYVTFAISSAAGNAVTGTPPFGDPEQIVVGVSHDEGQSWHLRLVKAGGVGALAGLIFPWITLDAAGNVYVSWAGRDSERDPIDVFYASSTDHGETWSAPHRVNADSGGHAHIYTTISGGDPGVVDVAWYTSSTPDPSSSDNDWYVDFAQIRRADTADPEIRTSRVYPESIHHGDICLQGLLCVAGGDRSLLDFFQVQVGPDGVANIAFANNGSPDDRLRVWYARQASGPLAGSGLHDASCPAAPGGPGPRTSPQPAPAPPGPVVGGRRVTAPRALPGTGTPDPRLLAWILLAAGTALAARLRLGRR
jgi:hypothetical protein